MDGIQTCKASDQHWATALEFVNFAPISRTETIEFESEPDLEPRFLVAVLTSPDLRPAPVDAQLVVKDQYKKAYVETNVGKNGLVEQRLVVVQAPEGNQFTLECTNGIYPYALNVMTFHPTVDTPEMKAAAASGPAKPPFRCRFCKTSSKALAAALGVYVAANAAPPAALLAALASFLGYAAAPTAIAAVHTAAASAFVSAIYGDTVDGISTRMCQWVRACP